MSKDMDGKERSKSQKEFEIDFLEKIRTELTSSEWMGGRDYQVQMGVMNNKDHPSFLVVDAEGTFLVTVTKISNSTLMKIPVKGQTQVPGAES